uniref:HTH_48 domain-containing protein n=1 Tax=Heterorhabditis bacteriophora TaxID=37862 RepID=A0A1I7W9K9_HETBA
MHITAIAQAVDKVGKNPFLQDGVALPPSKTHEDADLREKEIAITDTEVPEEGFIPEDNSHGKLREKETEHDTAQHWFRRFRNGDESLGDEEGHGGPVAIDDSQMRASIEVDPRRTTQEVVEELDVADPTVVRHLHQIGKPTKARQMGAARAERIPEK